MNKKIIAFVSSRRNNSNTLKFVNQVKDKVNLNKIDFEIITSKDMKYKDVYEFKIGMKDDISELKKKIIDSDFVILASPIMVHNISADMKSFIERSSSWGHSMRLFGKKKSYVITTNYSNGHMTGINYLSRILTTFGTEVIGASNAAECYPNQLNNSEWVDKVTSDIGKMISKEVFQSPKSNNDLENIFSTLKNTMVYYKEAFEQKNDYILNAMQQEELKFWLNNNMLNYNTYEELLLDKED
jgi:multimeric flavodoxin WrbA